MMSLRRLGYAVVIMCLGVFFSMNACNGSSSSGSELRRVAAGDISIAYRVFGSGYPLVMIMGLTGTMDIWDPDVIDRLSSGYQVIVFDNRGMGETSAGTTNFSIEQFADDTAHFMDAIGVSKAHILGWSLGTNIAQELILRHPDKVDKLILYAADCGGDEAIQPSDEVIEKILSGDPIAMLETLFPDDWFSVPSNREYIIDLFERIATESSTEENLNKQYAAWQGWAGCCSRLGEIERPTLLITGDSDVNTPTQNSLIMEPLIPDVTLTQVTDGGHGIMYQYPDQFAASVLSFLE